MMKHLLFLSITLSLFASCEKVIEFDLEESSQKIVIEGVLRNFVGESYVLISKTNTVYGSNTFEKAIGANVTVGDDDGNEFVFTESAVPGKYEFPAFAAEPNTTYSLDVTYNNKSYSATSTSPSIPVLDSLNYIATVGGFGSTDSDTNYLVFFFQKDLASEINYYRARPRVNGVIDDNFYINEDQLFQGQTFSQPFFATSIKPKDTVYVELSSFDKAHYKFLFSLANTGDGSPFTAVPANPVSNIMGEDVLGYFTALMIDSKQIILP